MAIDLKINSTFNDKGIKDAQSGATKVASGWDKAGDALGRLAVPAAVGFGAVTVGAKKALGATRDQAGSLRDLNSVMNSMGYAHLADEVNGYAEATSKATGMDDEAIRKAQMKLVAMENIAGNTELIGRATATAADLAAAGFGDLDSTATLLAKALEKPEQGMARLSRMGIQLSDSQQEAVKTFTEMGNTAAAQDVIMRELEKRYGSVAEEGASGMDLMKQQWEETLEILGKNLLPMFNLFIGVLKTVGTWIGENTKLFAILVMTFAALTGGILLANAAFAAYNAIVKVVTVVTKAWTIAQKLLNKALLANPIGLVIAAVMLLVGALVYAWRNSETFRNIVTSAFEAVKRVAETVFNAIKKIIQTAWDFIVAIWKVTPFGFLITHLEDLKRIFGEVWDWILEKITAISDKILGIIDNVVEGIKKAIDWINPFNNSFGSNVGTFVASGPSTFSAGSFAAPAPINITVTGAIDPTGTAKTIRRVLDDYERTRNVRRRPIPAL